LSDQEAANDAGRPVLAANLGGEVSTQFTYGTPADYAASVEAARLEQQLICGYMLRVISLRQTHTRDDQGRDIYEVFAKFGPVEEKPWTEGDTLVAPSE